jgi:hypothetical protein
MNEHDRRSRREATSSTGSISFSAGADSPVRTDSSHSSSFASSRQVRRHDVAHADPNDVARHELGHVDGRILAVAQRVAPVPELRVERLDCARRPVLADEAESDAEPADEEDDQRIRSLAERHGGESRREQQEQERASQLTREDCDRSRAVTSDHVRSYTLEPSPRLRGRQTATARVEIAYDVFGRLLGRSDQVEFCLHLACRTPSRPSLPNGCRIPADRCLSERRQRMRRRSAR